MTFEAWLETKGVSCKAFELRHPNVQAQMIEEYNNINRTKGRYLKV